MTVWAWLSTRRGSRAADGRYRSAWIARGHRGRASVRGSGERARRAPGAERAEQLAQAAEHRGGQAEARAQAAELEHGRAQAALEGERQLRARLEQDLADAGKRLQAAEKARDAAIAGLEQAATRGTTPRGRR